MSSLLPNHIESENLRQPNDLPPVDGTLTIDQIFEWNRVNVGDSPCMLWVQDDYKKRTMSWKDFGFGVDRATSLIEEALSEVFRQPETPSTDDYHNTEIETPIVVAILSNSDAVTYSTLLLALERLTHAKSDDTVPINTLLPFPLSTRNSAAAIEHLLRVANVKYIYVSDGPMQNLLEEALKQREENEQTLKVFTMPTFGDLYPILPVSSSVSVRQFPTIPLDTPGLILHSSGSTSMPKPITITHRTLLEWAASLKYGGMRSEGEVVAVHGLPIFHAMGCLAMWWSAANLFVRAVSSPYAKVSQPTPEYFLSQVVASEATIVYTVPSFIEAWAEDGYSVQVLQRLKALMFAGAPLSQRAGAFLHSKGVRIRCLFGATEFGQVSTIPAEPHREGYEWFTFSPFTTPHFTPQEEDNTFEVVFKENPAHHPSKLNISIGGVPAYVTSDLLERHPVNKKLWRIKGRQDDQLVLSTGEKTNPGPLEDIITRNKHVRGAVIFGRGRPQIGILIEPVSWTEFSGAKEFREAIWASIEEANAIAPSHARIFKEMIIFSSPEKVFSYTAKGTPRRGAILREFDAEIEELYTAVLESSQVDIQAPTVTNAGRGWSVEESVDFVREVVIRSMKSVRTLTDTGDIFECGCDSLEATYIRNTLLRGLRGSVPLSHIRKLPSNLVYLHPSIQQLGAYISQVSAQSDGNIDVLDSQTAHMKEMDDIVHKFTTGFITHSPSIEAKHGMSDVVLLTGSTGGLGSQLLAQLVELSAISKVYAFNRPGTTGISSRDRQRMAFLNQGIDISILQSEKIAFVEGDTSTSDLGITEELLNGMLNSVTVIIHNAWPVDFKMTLTSFEPAIRGLRNIVDFALSSRHREPPRLIFTSSIGILRSWLPDKIPEVAIDDSNLISTSGYGASKWVSERILHQAAAQTSLKPIIVRVGQLSGGPNGSWNVREWFPSLIRGSQILGCIPDVKGMVSWIPIHTAAAALIDLRDTGSPVAHLVHPRPVPWTMISESVSRILGLPLVAPATWLSLLQAATSQFTEEDLRDNPALRLVEFYDSLQTPAEILDPENKEAMGMAMFETKVIEHEAPSLSSTVLPQLQEADVVNWISYWRKNQFLDI